MPFKKDLTPLSKKGTISIHRGKGSQTADTSTPSISNPFTASLNDYSKAVPVGPSMATPDQSSDFG